MAEGNSPQPTLQLLTCPHCQGRGKINEKKCSGCFGVKAAAWNGSHVLYWGKEINAWQLYHKKTQNATTNIINFSLLVFGIIGFIALGQWFITADQTIEIWKFYKMQNWQLFIFWLSTATDTYLMYRINRQLEKIYYIPKRKYQAGQGQIQTISWEQIAKLEKEQKIDISKYFTDNAIKSVEKSWQLTQRYKQHEVMPIHLLIALLGFDDINIVFSRLGVPFASLKNKIVKTLGKIPPWEGFQVTFSLKIYQILFNAYHISWQHRQGKVELTEILEALVADENNVQELLYDLKVDVDKIRNVVAWVRIKRQLRQNLQRFRQRAILKPKGAMNRSMTAIATPVLNNFGEDLTIMARNGYLMPCVGRDKEIEEIFRIMRGGTRRSALLIGNPGVGRTTIIEGIAQRMVEEDVPGFLQDKRLVNVSIAKLTSGASASAAQERLMAILTEVKRSGNIILAFTDIHNMVGITAGKEGSIDLSGVLARTLADKSVLALATTTPDSYKRYIEGKTLLENTLEQVSVLEVSGNEAIQILEAKAGTIEYRNKVYFSYDAIAQTVKLADRYLHDRYLPEKAIEILHEVAARVGEQRGKEAMVKADDVALIISEKTNIPLTEITKEESEKLLKIEEKIHERVIDQAEAVKMVSSALRRARAEMRDVNRPIVNLLFLGPTGVGKTELAKTVAHVYFGDEKNMIRLDMSEYQEKSSINRLLGAPPGYGGSDAGGYLTEAVRKNPFSLVLLDEIEKAHPDIVNIFLQVLDDGRLTDTSGRTIDFTNVILIGTSNAGTEIIQNKIRQGVAIEKIRDELVENELTKFFRPELLNRFDGIIVFKPLTMAEVQAIAKLMLQEVKANLENRGIKLKVTSAALAELSEAGFDPTLGARPLRRVIQQRVEDQLANYLLEGKIDRRDTVVVEGGGKIIIEKAPEI